MVLFTCLLLFYSCIVVLVILFIVFYSCIMLLYTFFIVFYYCHILLIFLSIVFYQVITDLLMLIMVFYTLFIGFHKIELCPATRETLLQARENHFPGKETPPSGISFFPPTFTRYLLQVDNPLIQFPSRSSGVCIFLFQFVPGNQSILSPCSRALAMHVLYFSLQT